MRRVIPRCGLYTKSNDRGDFETLTNNLIISLLENDMFVEFKESLFKAIDGRRQHSGFVPSDAQVDG